MARSPAVILECPECQTRYTLRRYVPENRVRYRKCRSIVMVPRTNDAALPAIDSTRREKIVRTLSLRLFASLAAASVLVAVLLGWWAYRRWSMPIVRLPSPKAAESLPPLSVEALPKLNKTLPMPLGSGFMWDYDGPEDGERQEVNSVFGSLHNSLTFEFRIRGRAHSISQDLRLQSDGLYIVSETRGGANYTFEPPLKILKLPLFLEDSWLAESNYVRNDGGSEPWKLRFKVEGSETVTVGAGTFSCYRIRVTGARGVAEWDETVWYAKGVGLVKRTAKNDPGRSELTLRSYLVSTH